MTNNKRIKATFSGCCEFKHLFPVSHCVLAISVGQESHEGEKLKATLELVSNSFSKCTILVGDSLQRHNFAFLNPLNQDDHYEHSIHLGDEWIARNSSLFPVMTIPYSIKRWDEWLTSLNFELQLDKVKKCYRTNQMFQNAIKSTIDRFIEKIKNRGTVNQNMIPVITKASLNYLIEEIAVLLLMMPEENYHYIVYPSKMIKALEAAYQLLLKDVHKHLMKWVRVHHATKK